MKTESKPTSSARHEKPSNLPGANCSADALYPSLITARLLADAVVPVAEIYRLAGNQQPAKAGKLLGVHRDGPYLRLSDTALAHYRAVCFENFDELTREIKSRLRARGASGVGSTRQRKRSK